MYGLAAAAALAYTLGRGRVWLSALALVAALAGLVVSAPGALEFLSQGQLGELFGAMSSDRPWVESAREFIGALVALDYAALALVLGLRRRKPV